MSSNKRKTTTGDDNEEPQGFNNNLRITIPQSSALSTAPRSSPPTIEKYLTKNINEKCKVKPGPILQDLETRFEVYKSSDRGSGTKMNLYEFIKLCANFTDDSIPEVNRNLGYVENMFTPSDLSLALTASLEVKCKDSLEGVTEADLRARLDAWNKNKKNKNKNETFEEFKKRCKYIKEVSTHTRAEILKDIEGNFNALKAGETLENEDGKIRVLKHFYSPKIIDKFLEDRKSKFVNVYSTWRIKEKLTITFDLKKTCENLYDDIERVSTKMKVQGKLQDVETGGLRVTTKDKKTTIEIAANGFIKIYSKTENVDEIKALIKTFLECLTTNDSSNKLIELDEGSGKFILRMMMFRTELDFTYEDLETCLSSKRAKDNEDNYLNFVQYKIENLTYRIYYRNEGGWTVTITSNAKSLDRVSETITAAYNNFIKDVEICIKTRKNHRLNLLGDDLYNKCKSLPGATHKELETRWKDVKNQHKNILLDDFIKLCKFKQNERTQTTVLQNSNDDQHFRDVLSRQDEQQQIEQTIEQNFSDDLSLYEELEQDHWSLFSENKQYYGVLNRTTTTLEIHDVNSLFLYPISYCYNTSQVKNMMYETDVFNNNIEITFENGHLPITLSNVNLKLSNEGNLEVSGTDIINNKEVSIILTPCDDYI
jgi:hypothetical protein